IEVDGMPMTILEASSAGNDGWYAGYAKVSPLMLGGAAYTVKFDRLYIREDLTAGFGRVDILSKGVAAMVEEQLAAQTKRQKERQKRENRSIWTGVAFYENVFMMEDVIIDTVLTDPYGNIAIVDAEGNQSII